MPHRAGIIGVQDCALLTPNHLRHHGAVMHSSAPAADRNRLSGNCGQRRRKEERKCDDEQRIGNHPAHALS